MTIAELKTKLAQFIETAEKATAGPWTKQTPLQHIADAQATHSVDGPPSDFMFLENEDDATFIAQARTIGPQACKALLVAIDGIETVLHYGYFEEKQDREGLKDTLNEILEAFK